MGPVLPRRLTTQDSTREIVSAIHFLAKRNAIHLPKDDHIEWLEMQMKEIARLAWILRKRKGLR